MTNTKSSASKTTGENSTQWAGMSENHKIPILKMSGENYIQWTGFVKRRLKTLGALEAIKEGNKCFDEIKAKADDFLHLHIDETLEFEHSSCDDPCQLWKNLDERFNNQRDVLLPNARDDWNNLRFQDFRSVNEYTSALFRICRTLRFCGQTVTQNDMLEKTFSTFHPSNINLQQQYRLQKFNKYSDLNTNLLVAERNNELLMKNHQSRPTGSLAIPEANVVNSGNKRGRGNPRVHGRGQNRGRGHGRGHYDHNRFSNQNHNYHRGGYNGRGRGRGNSRGQRNYTYHAPQNNNQKNNEVGTSRNHEGGCYRCGNPNHWAKACRTAPHICEQYQASIKGKEKEVNHVDHLNNANTELVASDFFDDFEV